MKEKRPNYHFGEKIRQVRESQKITLKSLATQMGVSSSLLSQIENNRVSPSIDTLLNLAEILDIDPEYLFRDFRKKRQVKICHKEERSSLDLNRVNYTLLTPLPSHEEESPLEALELVIEPGAELGNKNFGHQGKEIGLVLEGEAELCYGSEIYKLKEGDSLSFSSTVPHRVINRGEKLFKALWIITPPRLFTE